jgi:hypothetical protein
MNCNPSVTGLPGGASPTPPRRTNGTKAPAEWRRGRPASRRGKRRGRRAAGSRNGRIACAGQRVNASRLAPAPVETERRAPPPPGSSRTSTRSARPLVFPGVTRLLGHVDQEDAVVADVGEGGAEEQDVTQHLVPGIGGMLLDSGREQPVKYLAERPWLVGLFFVLARVVVSLPGVMGSEAFGVEGARVERGDPGGGRLDDLPPPRLSTSASSRSW